MIVNNGKGWLVRGLLHLVVGVLLSGGSVRAQLEPRHYAVELTVEVRNDPSEIVLHWRGDPNARGYTINRKERISNGWAKVGTAAGHETWFIDANVTKGVGYEYQVVKEGALNYTGYGYIYAGIEVPLVENRGAIILLVESSIAEPLVKELQRLEWDLIGDGWKVVRWDVPRTASVMEVREVIRSIYAADPQNVRSVFLFGNIPVPYSGNLTPDEHDDHKGAWPADVYYGDLDGPWTDDFVTATGAARTSNHNYPGDGKFDQSEIPSKMELEVGRVDLSRMTCFQNKSPSRSEVDLLRVYLEKDHAFRHGRMAIASRGLIFDRVGLSQPEPLGTMAWRNFAPFVGGNVDVIQWAEYFPTVSSKTYLWSSVVAGGGLSHSDGVGSSDAFALYNVNVVFGMFSGSYYGDWDNESNFLRAALGANGRILASMYSGQPQWICHTMALGETIGAAAKLTQDNNEQGIYVPHNRGAGQVHVALHGDPSLRAHPIPSPSDLSGSARDGGIDLSWVPAQAPGAVGYYIYEADNAAGPFRRMTAAPVTTAQYYAAQPAKQYMVRTVALTASPSGSYWNLSQGTFYPDPTAPTDEVPAAPRDLVVAGVGPERITVRWVSSSFEQSGFEIERLDPGASSFVRIGTVVRDQVEYTDAGVSANSRYSYRVRAVNGKGASDYSNVVVASTAGAFAEFVGMDRRTKGRWIGRYGSEGYAIPNIADELPTALSMTMSNVYTAVFNLREEDRALQVPGSELRSINIWKHFMPFAFHLRFSDDQVRQVAFYVMSHSGMAEWLDIEVLDAVTGTVLDKRRVENIFDGVYLVYYVSRQVIIRVTPPGYSGHGEVYGFFFDPAKVAPAQIEPASGTFAGKMLVSMASVSESAEIRYTVDGSEPTETSTRYTEPFLIYADTNVRARAFRANYPPSDITDALYRNTAVSEFGFIGWNETDAGDWVEKFGKEGFWLAGGGKELPAYVELSWLPESAWLWNGAAEDRRAPFADRSKGSRVAAAWYDGEELTLDLGVLETQRRAVGLFFLDWDRQGRVQRVESLDAAGNVKDAHLVQDFSNGKYLVLGVKGYVKLRIKRVNGPNAVLNGLFFDVAPVEINVGAPVPLTNPVLRNNVIWLTVTGTANQRFCLDESWNLQDWVCTKTNVISAPQFQIQVPVSPQPVQFLRGHIVP